MFTSQSDYSEVVLLFGHKSVTKQMPFSEFEAILDGYASIPELAGQVRAVYAVVDYALHIKACVFFLVEIKADGSVDKSWNIPLRHMIDIAGSGPDLGAGAIRLVCRSQCPISWHQNNLWDPAMGSGKDDFRSMVALIKENRLCLPVREKPLGPEAQGPMPAWGFHPPVFHAPTQPWAVAPYPWGAPATNQAAWASAPAHWGPPPQAWHTGSVAAVQPVPDSTQRSHRDSEDRQKTARLLRKLRLQVHTLENGKNSEIAALNYAHQKDAENFKIQQRRLQNLVDSLTEQNVALKEQLQSQKSQLDALSQSVELKLEAAAEHEKQEIMALKQHFQKRLEENEVEEIARLREVCQIKEMELIYKEEIGNQLREDVVNLRREKLRLLGAGADKFLEKLERLGISFINYHPGVGHLSIPLQDMARYIEDTDAYVAEKCLIPKPQYLKWRAHYDNPVCGCEVKGGLCGTRLTRLESPAKYLEGVSDRCAKHQRHAGNDDAYSAVKVNH